MARFRNRTINGCVYDLSHLDPFAFPVTHEETERIVRVTFDDHVFTEAHDPDRHTPDLICSRRPGDWRAFNLRRWELSRELPELFLTLGGQAVYQAKGRNFFFLRGQAPYVVFFQVRRSDREEADVHVIVRSAYDGTTKIRGVKAAIGVAEGIMQPDCMADERTAPQAGPVLQLKAGLLGISPMIRRRILVPEAMTLHELHGVLQAVIHLLTPTVCVRKPKTAFVEATVNTVVGKRLWKAEAHLILRTGPRVLDGTLGTKFQS